MVWYPGKRIVQGIQNIGSNIMDRRRDAQALRERAQGPQGPAPQNTMAGSFGADRASQMGALGMFRQGAMGQGPSLALMQQQAGNQANLVNQLGVTAMGSGGSLAAQQRQAAGQGAAAGMALNRDAAMLRAQEQAQAQQAYADQANLMAGMSGQAMGQNADLATQWGLGQRGMDLQALDSRRQNQLGWADRIIGAGMGAGQIAMFSDETLKTGIEVDEDAAGETLASLKPVRYRYKDERHGPTDEDTIGILAQDLERTPLGKRIVREVPGEGKALETGGLLSLLAAGGASHEQRLRRLEGRE